jgi:excisionase family DNA binding protein
MCKGNPTSKSRNHKFLKIPEVAEELNKSERSVWRLIEDGDLPSYLFGDSRRVSREDLYDYINRCRK